MSETELQPNNTELKRNSDGTFAEGNPGGPGRPKGKTMKEFARDFFYMKTDEEKKEYIEKLEEKKPGFAWEMGEGKAKQDVDLKGNLTIAQVLNELDGQATIGQELENESSLQDPQQSGSDGGIQDESSPAPLQPEQVV